MEPKLYMHISDIARLPCHATGSKNGSAPGSSSMDFRRFRIFGKSSFLIWYFGSLVEEAAYTPPEVVPVGALVIDMAEL